MQKRRDQKGKKENDSDLLFALPLCAPSAVFVVVDVDCFCLFRLRFHPRH
jgi:hypothetical protein